MNLLVLENLMVITKLNFKLSCNYKPSIILDFIFYLFICLYLYFGKESIYNFSFQSGIEQQITVILIQHNNCYALLDITTKERKLLKSKARAGDIDISDLATPAGSMIIVELLNDTIKRQKKKIENLTNVIVQLTGNVADLKAEVQKYKNKSSPEKLVNLLYIIIFYINC